MRLFSMFLVDGESRGGSLTALGLPSNTEVSRLLSFGGGSPHLRHGHREAFDGHIVIKGLQNIFREQRVVHSSIFILLQPRELARPYIDHLCDEVLSACRCRVQRLLPLSLALMLTDVLTRPTLLLTLISESESGFDAPRMTLQGLHA